ncbi:MAG: hypothetical protein HY692_09950 [Cyanobacteria bacterium NC_groundwater_1444_Ag_S-0.65um_54_12]|nr:hypothetical protein [Cyanobacteria bacterium NC_groundwater_1444_Ag_S-0.65um_54_12]
MLKNQLGWFATATVSLTAGYLAISVPPAPAQCPEQPGATKVYALYRAVNNMTWVDGDGQESKVGWSNNLRQNIVDVLAACKSCGEEYGESGSQNIKKVKEAVGLNYTSIANYIDLNIGNTGARNQWGEPTSDGIVLINTNGSIVGVIPVSSMEQAYNELTGYKNIPHEVTLKGGATMMVNITGYAFHDSPIILDLAGTGKPDLLASSDWNLRPGRLLAMNALRSFDLNGQGAMRWEWAGPTAGILVWDPGRTGKITSGKQLFGNHTWGKHWENGYQALATLDVNKDKWLMGKELVALSIWVDANSNGSSEPAEVKPVQQHGIEAIAVNSTTDEVGNAWAPRGFVRSGPDGQRQTLASWDWIALGGIKGTAVAIDKLPKLNTAKLAKGKSGPKQQSFPTGYYFWLGNDNEKDIGGFLRLEDHGNNTIKGVSFPFIGHDPLPKDLLAALPLTGKVQEGQLVWQGPSFKGSKVLSRVELKNAGTLLYGQTTLTYQDRQWSYRWRAALLAGNPIGQLAKLP